MADAAYKCEEKEEKLVKDAVLHLTQANSQIKDLHHQFTHKVNSGDTWSTGPLQPPFNNKLFNIRWTSLPDKERKLTVYCRKFAICRKEFRNTAMRMMTLLPTFGFTRCEIIPNYSTNCLGYRIIHNYKTIMNNIATI